MLHILYNSAYFTTCAATELSCSAQTKNTTIYADTTVPVNLYMQESYYKAALTHIHEIKHLPVLIQ